ncbi:MAG: hypothetical protein E7Z77_00705 [Methanobrevibacter sp.]|uniref:hypothetical protein n=1 Tax=Methanobrevibacter sp. TaxID=66852 RepID=UPI0025EE420E|nr:hypothetical protein [Methanobrevibacter sp.]MBE6507911.1 hypothetical protein [Methanobrevibacter sp.]
MKKKYILYLTLFSILFCCIFTILNPNIAQDYPCEFRDGEVFTPTDGHYDFRTFSLNSSNAKNFTTRIVSNGHVMLVDDTGNITVNVIEPDKMIPTKKGKINSLLCEELHKPSWTVDGVCVHQISFMFYENLYASFQKNSTTNTIIYLSSPNEKETADLMNSLTFNAQ